MNHNSVDQVSVKSNFYEQLAEHVFISELLQEVFLIWQNSRSVAFGNR